MNVGWSPWAHRVVVVVVVVVREVVELVRRVCDGPPTDGDEGSTPPSGALDTDDCNGETDRNGAESGDGVYGFHRERAWGQTNKEDEKNGTEDAS